MSKLVENFEDIEWTDDVSGIDHWIESDKAVEECAQVCRDFALSFLRWEESLTEDEIGSDTYLELLRFFETDVY